MMRLFLNSFPFFTLLFSRLSVLIPPFSHLPSPLPFLSSLSHLRSHPSFFSSPFSFLSFPFSHLFSLTSFLSLSFSPLFSLPFILCLSCHLTFTWLHASQSRCCQPPSYTCRIIYSQDLSTVSTTDE